LDIPLVTGVSCEEVISKGLVITTPTLQSTQELFMASGMDDQTMSGQKKIKLGSYAFVTGHHGLQKDLKTSVYIAINDLLKGRFVFENKYVEGIQHMVSQLSTAGYKIDVLSGDNASEKATLQKLFSNQSEVLFNQKPEDKLQHIKQLQANQHQVMMVGDGLNDSVALQQSTVGLAIIHDHTQFSPSSDAILAASEVNQLPSFIKYCKSGIGVVKGSFIFSSMYNAFGLSFAVQGLFSPVFAAILMPISSITVVLFSVLLTNYKAKQILKKYPNP
jgi:Cu+-exporting ATPase